MRVAILSSGLGHVFRGVESWSQELAYGLKEHGVDVTLFKGGGLPNSSIEKVVPCLHRGSSKTKLLIKLLPSFVWHFGFGSAVQAEGTTFSFAVLKVLRRYDIIHTQEPPVAQVILLAQKLGLLNCNLIIANGTNEPIEYFKKYKYVQFLSDYYLSEARKNNYINHQKWFSMPNFVNTDIFNPKVVSNLRSENNIPSDAVVILSVAAVTKFPKRIDYLIGEVEQLMKISNENIYLMIAGATTKETPEVIALAKKRLKDKVFFLLDQPYDKMPQIYAAADIFALCSLHETFGNVFLEAMASGLPTLGYTHPIMQWILSGGGECVDMTSEGTLAQAFKKYLDPYYRKSIGRKVREYVVNEFSRDVVVKKFIQQYKLILLEKNM